MRMTFALLALLALGCGGSPPPVDGTWSRKVNDACALALTVHHDAGTFSAAYMCLLAGGDRNFGADALWGHADVYSDALTLTPNRASCPGNAPASLNWHYTITDSGQLSISDAGGLELFSRAQAAAPDPSGGPSLVFGCWTDDLSTFTPHDVTNL